MAVLRNDTDVDHSRAAREDPGQLANSATTAAERLFVAAMSNKRGAPVFIIGSVFGQTAIEPVRFP